jgi:RHS repeat-associated protein
MVDMAFRTTQVSLPNGSVVSLGYDESDRLTYIGDVNPATGVGFKYGLDANGNRTTITENDASVTVNGFDMKNRLISEVRTGTSPYSAVYAYAPDDSLLARDLPSGGRGTARRMEDSSRTVQASMVFDAYGLQRSTATLTSSYGFVGEEGVRAEKGLAAGVIVPYQMRARMYDPLIGRFVSRDPVFSNNLYAYANGNPWSYTDPDGMEAESSLSDLFAEVELLSAGIVLAHGEKQTTPSRRHSNHGRRKRKDTAGPPPYDPVKTSGYLEAMELHPAALAALSDAHIKLGRVMQAIGNAKASKGTHLGDESLPGSPFGVVGTAVDISVRSRYGRPLHGPGHAPPAVAKGYMSLHDITHDVRALRNAGFAAWFRPFPGSHGKLNFHIHAIFPAPWMKNLKANQVIDFIMGKTGLSLHGIAIEHRRDRRVPILPHEAQNVMVAAEIAFGPRSLERRLVRAYKHPSLKLRRLIHAAVQEADSVVSIEEITGPQIVEHRLADRWDFGPYSKPARHVTHHNVHRPVASPPAPPTHQRGSNSLAESNENQTHT